MSSSDIYESVQEEIAALKRRIKQLREDRASLLNSIRNKRKRVRDLKEFLKNPKAEYPEN